MKMTYKNRVADILLVNQLNSAGAVLIQGPKWCGKTTTAEQNAKSVIYPDFLSHNQEKARHTASDSSVPTHSHLLTPDDPDRYSHRIFSSHI